MTTDHTTPAPQDENHIIAERRAKLTALREAGQAFPNDFRRDSLAGDLAAKYGDKTKEELDALNVSVKVAGRMMLKRVMGKASFATVQDMSGRIQFFVTDDGVGAETHDAFKHWDMGDIIAAEGVLFKTNRGELSVKCATLRILTKSLRPLPEKFHGLTDQEQKYRQRYVDLIVRPEARNVARQRIAVVRALRSALERRGFLEVETPMLQTLPGGAAARPFITHSNALDADLYLRIAPELFLKRCLVGGFEKVFELNRNFRNEGADSTHSPEFAMLETYQAYGTYDDSAIVTRELIQEVADEAIGTRMVPLPDGSAYDLDGEWATIEMYPSLSEALGEEITPETSVEYLWRVAERLGAEIPRDRGYGHGKLIEELWEHTVGEHLWAPTFVRDFPVETTPLTRAHRSIPGVTEKWDLYVRKFELATGYSELIDPVIQRARFEDQARAAAAGDDEAMRLDEDFLIALEYAMPPTTGTGMGLDRLLMALTGLTIRDTVLFPIVRRQAD